VVWAGNKIRSVQVVICEEMLRLLMNVRRILLGMGEVKVYMRSLCGIDKINFDRYVDKEKVSPVSQKSQ